jgi:ABC-2 type transport system ATP-binding protein
MIEGMLPIDRGTVRVQGIDVARDPDRVRRLVGVQLQKAAFFEQLTLTELLSLFGDLYGQRIDPRSLLAQVDLVDEAKRTIKKLSGGQQQRFGIAVALVNNPAVLFLDEPTTGLDPHARRNLWETIRAFRQEGRSIVLTTHYIEEAEALCDHVAIMDAGRIVATDRPINLIRELLATGFKKEIAIPPATLEDVFLQITGRQLHPPGDRPGVEHAV